MRILFVLHQFLPETQGGTELYASQLLEELRKGHEVCVFYRAGEPARPDYEVSHSSWQGIPCIAVNYHYRDFRDFSSTYTNPRMEELFREVLRDIQPDAVHFHHFTGLSVGLPRIAKEEGLRAVVVTMHDFWTFCAQGQRVRRDLVTCAVTDPAVCAACQVLQHDVPRFLKVWPRIVESRLIFFSHRGWGRKLIAFGASIQKHLLRLWGGRAREGMMKRESEMRRMLDSADLCLAPSHAVLRHAKAAGFPAGRLQLAVKGSADFHPVPRSSQREGFRLVYLGTMIPSKGPQVLLQAFRHLKGRHLKLDFHGPFFHYDGFSDFERRFRLQAARDTRVHLMGPYAREKLKCILAEADLVVVPSLWCENRPLVIEEALQALRPVVASDVESIREQIQEGENGLLFRAGDWEDLRRVLKKFIEKPGVINIPGRLKSPVQTIREDADFHARLYAGLIRSQGRVQPAGFA